MSYINLIKDIEFEIASPPRLVDGEFEFETFQGFEWPRGSGRVWEYPNTKRKHGTVHPNIVTDLGLDYYGQGWTVGGTFVTGKTYQTEYCQVGTGTAAESATDTALASFVAAKAAGSVLTGYSAQGSPPYYGSIRSDYLFSPNFAGGNVNLNEVGVGFTLASGTLSSRALTKDSGGSPATVPVLSTEYLRVYYTRRNYPGHIIEATGAPDDLTGTVDIGGTNYTYTMRPARVTDNDWGQQCCTPCRPTSGFGFDTTFTASAFGSDAVIGAVTAQPSSASFDGATSSSSNAYTLNSYNRTFGYFWDIGDGNVTGGIKGIIVKSSFGCYQIVFNNAIPKNSGNALTYYHNWSWARK